jgi:hypothetical protein
MICGINYWKNAGGNMALANQKMNDLNQQKEQRAGNQANKPAIMQAFRDGYSCGAKDARDHLKPAISDGLRAGSSQCARAMNDYKKDK